MLEIKIQDYFTNLPNPVISFILDAWLIKILI